MPQSTFERLYFAHEFEALPLSGIAGNLAIIEARMRALPLAVPIARVELVGGSTGILVSWADLAPATNLAPDIALLDALVPTITGGPTTSQTFSLESFAAQQTQSASPVLKASLQTTPLDAGTITFSWNSLLRMNPAAANSGVQGLVRITRSDGVSREQPDSWDLTANHAFNGSMIFEVSAGQSLLAEAFVSRLGSGGTAEMAGVRLTLDRRAPPAQ